MLNKKSGIIFNTKQFQEDSLKNAIYLEDQTFVESNDGKDADLHVIKIKTNILNRFSSYIPVNHTIKTQNIFEKLFPYSYDIYDEEIKDELILHTQDEWRSNGVKLLLELYQKFSLKMDFQEKKALLFKQKHQKVFLDPKRLKLLQRYFNQQEQIISQNITVTVEPGFQLSSSSIVSTANQFFCCRCISYNCATHSLDSFDGLELPKLEINYQKARQLIQYYRQVVCQNKDNNIFLNQSCGKDCFINVKWSEELQTLKRETKKINNEQMSFIEVIINTIGFKPCNISTSLEHMILPCKYVFVYLFEYFFLIEKFKSQQNQSTQPSIINQNSKISYNSLYQPCEHPGQKCTQYCHPYNMDRQFCDKFCTCSEDCSFYRPLCKCIGDCTSVSCLCQRRNIECDPDNCQCTLSHKFCSNQQIQLNLKPELSTRPSQICQGLGLFANENIHAGQLVTIYFGELITEEELDLRQYWDEQNSLLYCFQILDQIIEARYFANNSRFANHSQNYVQLRYQKNINYLNKQGDYYQAFYAIKDILKNDEILINYDSDGKIDQNDYPWIMSDFCPSSYSPCTRIRVILNKNQFGIQ